MQRAVSSVGVGGLHAAATGMYHPQQMHYLPAMPAGPFLYNNIIMPNQQPNQSTQQPINIGQTLVQPAPLPLGTPGGLGRVHNAPSQVMYPQQEHQVDISPSYVKPSTSEPRSRAIKIADIDTQNEVKVSTQKHQVYIAPSYAKPSTSKSRSQAIKIVDIDPQNEVKVSTQKHQVYIAPSYVKPSTSKPRSRAIKIADPDPQNEVKVSTQKHQIYIAPSYVKPKPRSQTIKIVDIDTQNEVQVHTQHEQEALPKPLPPDPVVTNSFSTSNAAVAAEFKSKIHPLAGTDTPPDPGLGHSHPIPGPVLAPPSPSFSTLGLPLPYRPNAIITNPPDRVVRSEHGMIPPPPASNIAGTGFGHSHPIVGPVLAPPSPSFSSLGLALPHRSQCRPCRQVSRRCSIEERESFPMGDMPFSLKKVELVGGKLTCMAMKSCPRMVLGVCTETGSKVIGDATKFTSLLHNDTATYVHVPVKFTPTTSSTTLENIPDDLTSKTVDEREHTTARMDGMPQLGDISEMEEEPVILDTQEGVTPPPGESLPTGLWEMMH